jgi:hypothetical protein
MVRFLLIAWLLLTPLSLNAAPPALSPDCQALIDAYLRDTQEAEVRPGPRPDGRYRVTPADDGAAPAAAAAEGRPTARTGGGARKASGPRVPLPDEARAARPQLDLSGKVAPAQEVYAPRRALQVEAASVLDRYALAKDIPDYRELIARALAKDAESGERWFDKLLRTQLEGAQDRGDVVRIFKRLRELLGDEGREQPKVAPDRTEAVHGPTAKVGEVPKATPVPVVDANGTHGVKIAGAQMDVLGHPMRFPEVTYNPPPEGMTAQAWAEKAYGVKLEPFRTYKSLSFGEAINEASVETFLRENYKRSPYDLQGKTFAQAAADIVAGKEVAFERDGKGHSLKLDPSQPGMLKIGTDVTGGTRRLFRHPTNPNKLIKIYDPTLKPGIPPEQFAKMIQWDAARMQYFNSLADSMEARGEQPYFRVGYMSMDPKLILHGVAEVEFKSGQTLGQYIEQKGLDHPEPFIQNFAQGMRAYDPVMMQIGAQRYDLSLAHQVDSTATPYVDFFGHTVQKDVPGYGDVVFHGLDTGSIPEYDNVIVDKGPTGPVPFLIDL